MEISLTIKGYNSQIRKYRGLWRRKGKEEKGKGTDGAVEVDLMEFAHGRMADLF